MSAFVANVDYSHETHRYETKTLLKIQSTHAIF